MSTVRNILQQSIITGGVVVDPTNGIIKLFRPVGGQESLKTTTAGKFPAGTMVEVNLRTDGKKKTISRVVEVDKDAYYSVIMSAVATTLQGNVLGSKLKAAFKLAGSKFSAELLETAIAAGDQLRQVEVAVGVTYQEADMLRSALNQEFDSDGYFIVTKLDNQEMATRGIEVPLGIEALEYVHGHWIAPEIRPIFGVSARVAAFGQHLNLLLTGSSGFGKTSTAQALAKWLGWDCLRVNCAAISDVTGWFGEYEAKEGTTHFNPTRFSELIQRGNVVILLDEINRLESWLTNPLFGILDHDRATEVHNTEIKVGPGVIFVMTVNIGAQYAGTFVTDAAFLNRVDATLEVKAPPPDVERVLLLDSLREVSQRRNVQLSAEEVARREPQEVTSIEVDTLVNLLNKLRGVAEREHMGVDVSTRTGIKITNLLRLGLNLRQAVEYTIINSAGYEERKSIIDQVQLLLGVASSANVAVNPKTWNGPGKP